jgi:hypothetical protein
MIKVYVYLFALFAYITCNGQEKFQFIKAGPTGSILKINDHGPSALTYGAFIYGGDLAYIITTDKWYDAIDFQFKKGELSNELASSQKIMATHFQFEWYRLWNLYLLPNSSQLFGFQWYNAYTQTNRSSLSNNNIYYCFESSLLPEIKLLKKLEIIDKMPLFLYVKGSAALAGYIIRPSIASMNPISANGNYPSNFWDKPFAGRIVTLNKLQHYISTCGIEFSCNARIFIVLEYTWNYLSYKNDNPYYEISHQFTAQLGIRLK